MKNWSVLLSVNLLLVPSMKAQSLKPTAASPRIQTANGIVEGINDAGLEVFKGIPYAQPPVGRLRWRPPQPPENWEGVRSAREFGPGCLQRRIFGDMNFRFKKMSEDCLYLNVWTPAHRRGKKLPVLVYFYGGGFLAGDGSEPRYDGASMARNRGIVTVTVNYRLNVFGFFAYPGLTKESPHHASGNYGLLDQVQALRWVRDNIAAFGGDPKKVTIAGESAGSMSVSGLMASPLAQGLFRGAVGESGGLFGPLAPHSLAEGEERGVHFAQLVGAHSLADLRAMSGADLLKATARRGSPYFSVILDGYFLPKSPAKIFAEGHQAHVPLLLGWNSQESGYQAVLRGRPATPESFVGAVRRLYGVDAGEVLKVFPHATKAEVFASATDLAGDRFTAFSTWKWGELQAETGGRPVYRYFYSRPRPSTRAQEEGADSAAKSGGQPNSGVRSPASGAVHSAEIEYVMGNLPSNRVYDWTADDYKISNIFQGLVANFVKTGNPNGLGLPRWVAVNRGKPLQVLHIDVHTRLEPASREKQLELLDQLYRKADVSSR